LVTIDKASFTPIECGAAIPVAPGTSLNARCLIRSVGRFYGLDDPTMVRLDDDLQLHLRSDKDLRQRISRAGPILNDDGVEYQNIEARVNDYAVNGFADNCELIGLSKVIDRPLFVYQADGKTGKIFCNIVTSDGQGDVPRQADSICLWRIGDHFQLLVPTADLDGHFAGAVAAKLVQRRAEFDLGQARMASHPCRKPNVQAPLPRTRSGVAVINAEALRAANEAVQLAKAAAEAAATAAALAPRAPAAAAPVPQPAAPKPRALSRGQRQQQAAIGAADHLQAAAGAAGTPAPRPARRSAGVGASASSPCWRS